MATTKRPFDLSKCARPNILALEPYRCARDDYKDDGTNILLDANENAYGPALDLPALNGSAQDVDLLGLNRYPDPHQRELKQKLCDLRYSGVYSSQPITPDNLFVGVGSDEAIDAILRCFCVPGKDKILTCPPTYGMYGVSAQVNDLEVVKVPLLSEQGFQLDVESINRKLTDDPAIKCVYICSPGNPTANLISQESVQSVLEHPSWNGVVILDEAYIDFAHDGASLAEWVTEWPNLIVMQTLSKAFGLAGIRLGAAFTSPEIARLLNSLKAPYNISSPTSALATRALSKESLQVMEQNKAKILVQRERILKELPSIKGIGRFRGGTDSNFLLVEMLDTAKEDGGKPNNEVALAVYEQLAESKGVVVRFRGKEYGCLGCLRITVGTEKEVDRFLADIEAVLKDVLSKRKTLDPAKLQGAEKKANDVLS